MELQAQPLGSTRQRRQPRHVPSRTCIGCRLAQAKREFIRLVRTPEGVAEMDATGRRAGRGAYVHLDPLCLKESMRKGRLAHALRVAISQENQAALEADLLQALARAAGNASRLQEAQQQGERP